MFSGRGNDIARGNVTDEYDTDDNDVIFASFPGRTNISCDLTGNKSFLCN